MTTAPPSLLQLFLHFLKIGSTAFGGNVALVAAVRQELVERRRWLPDEALLDATTLGNLLPGPLAVNVVAACGFRMRGLAGALVSFAGILLPSFLLICLLAALYFRFGQLPAITVLFNSLIPGVAAVIAATVWQLFVKNATTWLQRGLVILAAVALGFSRNFITTLLVIVVAGAVGAWLLRQPQSQVAKPPRPPRNYSPYWFAASLVFIGLVLWWLPLTGFAAHIKQLALTFGSMSTTLFGGGYVFVPVISHVVVDELNWVTSREFTDGIAMGQITPGPIMISAAFIGWKTGGFWGAVAGTAGMFLPPSALMLIATQFTDRLKGNRWAEAIFRGVRPAVIGMIAASVLFIARSGPLTWQAALLFLLVLWLSLTTKISQAILVPAAGLLGWGLYYFFPV